MVAGFGRSVARQLRAAAQGSAGLIVLRGIYRIDCGAFSPFGMRVVYLRSCIRS
jgi:hypothetical protein